MRYKLKLAFEIEVETGNKNITEIENMVTSSYSTYCGESVSVIKRTDIT